MMSKQYTLFQNLPFDNQLSSHISFDFFHEEYKFVYSLLDFSNKDVPEIVAFFGKYSKFANRPR